MILSAYIAAIRLLIQPASDETTIYTDALLTEGLRVALREYALAAYPVFADVTVTAAGQVQSLGTLKPVEIVAVIWPFDAGVVWTQRLTARYAARWRWVTDASIMIESGEPGAGDVLRVWYRQQQTVKDLDAATVTTVSQAHEELVCLGAAGWAAELHYRSLSEAVKAPPVEQVRGLRAWSSLRLQEYRVARQNMLCSAAGHPVRPDWGDIGL